MRKKKIVNREQVSKGYTLELEEMTKSDKKKVLPCKMESPTKKHMLLELEKKKM